MTPTANPVQAHIPCNLCGGHQVTVVATRSRDGGPLRSVACTGCGLVWADPRPHDARKFYEEDYRLAYKKTFRPRPKHVLRAGRVALDRFRRILPLLGQPRTVLDVGSGGGEFSHLLALRGHSVVGVEPNRGYADYARHEYGLDIRRGFIGEVELAAGTFDVVTVWHVLEHTEDPGAVLGQLHRVLRTGGRLVLEVPNVEATCQSPRSSFHEAHLYTFSARTLRALAERYGFVACEISMSPDGGNITAIFVRREIEGTACAVRVPLQDHHAEVVSAIARHTPLAHALSAHPWRRAADRVTRMVSESIALARSGGATGRALLDQLYTPESSPSQPAANERPNRAHRWGWLAGAYALALAAEELLMDQVAPGGLGSSERLAAYLALQGAVVAALLWWLRLKPKSVRDVLKVGGWAAPLFVLPAVC